VPPPPLLVAASRMVKPKPGGSGSMPFGGKDALVRLPFFHTTRKYCLNGGMGSIHNTHPVCLRCQHEAQNLSGPARPDRG
jgi:hypothetical protein